MYGGIYVVDCIVWLHDKDVVSICGWGIIVGVMIGYCYGCDGIVYIGVIGCIDYIGCTGCIGCIGYTV